MMFIENAKMENMRPRRGRINRGQFIAINM